MKVLASVLLSLTVGGLLAGCGGGASVKPVVSFKPGGDDGGSTGSTTTAKPIEGVGTFSGTIKLKGDWTPSVIVAKGAATKDSTVCAAETAIVEQSLVVGPENGIANVFIYLNKVPPGAKVPPPPAEPAVFDQKGCVFVPHALVIRANQKVLVKSGDAVAHNTHTYPRRNGGFNQAIKSNERDGVPLFYTKRENEPFSVKCDMHSWMRAYHLAIDHPWGTTTNTKGEFTLTDVPATELEFRVWHEKAGGGGGFLQRSLLVKIEPGKTMTQDLEFELSAFGE
jgi:hypothetical protein